MSLILLDAPTRYYQVWGNLTAERPLSTLARNRSKPPPAQDRPIQQWFQKNRRDTEGTPRSMDTSLDTSKEEGHATHTRGHPR